MNIGKRRKLNDQASGADLRKILAQLTQLQIDQAKDNEKRDRREVRRDRWQWVQLAIAVVTVGALVLSYTSLKQQQQAAAQQDQESRYSSVSQLSLDVDKTIADNPRLICYFQETADSCKKKPALNQQDMRQAGAIATYMVDFYQYLYTQLENLGYAPDDGLFDLRGTDFIVRGPDANTTNESWVTWSETIFLGFQNSALACDALSGAAGAYEQRFVHAVAVTGVCPGLSDPG